MGCRYPVWVWSQVLALAAILGATLSSDFDTFTAFRSLQGLFGTIPQVVGLPIIHDMYAPEGKQIFMGAILNNVLIQCCEFQ